MSNSNNLINHRFGRLVVVEKVESRNGHSMWKCQCDCGKFKVVMGYKLINGNTKSCGCYKSEFVANKNYKHGYGTTNNKVYNTYHHIKQRCNNSNNKDYQNYGGRGIAMCDEWLNDFEVFYDYATNLPNYGEEGFSSIDRINNDGNYEPGNIRWATSKMQNNNRHRKVGD